MSKNRKHLIYVSSFPCLICGNPEAQAHHLLRAEPRGMGKKTSDHWAVPLCYKHHAELHDKVGNEIKFFSFYGWDYEKVKEYAISLRNPED